MSIEDEIMTRIATEMREAIDKDLIVKIQIDSLIKDGWTQVDIGKFDVVKSWHEVLIHQENFGNKWKAIDNRAGVWAVFWFGRDDFSTYRYIFANERDAALFILRWL
jgi:hypothetical protein